MLVTYKIYKYDPTKKDCLGESRTVQVSSDTPIGKQIIAAFEHEGQLHIGGGLNVGVEITGIAE